MAVVSPDLGYGATLGFGTSTFTASIRSISVGERTREVIDASHLTTTTNKRKLIGDLVDVGSFDVEFIWDSTSTKVPPIAAAAETITITLPDVSTIIGKGAVTSFGGPNIAIEDLMVGTMTVTWTGLDSAGTGAGPVIAASA